MKSIYFQTFGCRTNQEETVAYTASFRKLGYTPVKKPEEADIIVVNSCSVTGQAESKITRFVNSLSKKYPNAEIAVTGCLAQQTANEAREWDNVKWVIGNDEKNRITEIITKEESGTFSQGVTRDSQISAYDDIESPLIAARTRFSLKIQEGCDMVCSFCIVPSLRGPSRNLSFDEVIKTASEAVKQGYKELVITGTHIGQFKFEGKNYIDIIRAILDLNNEVRVRLSSMNPIDITDDLITLFKEQPRLCRHLHISLQSLSPNVLRLMKRPVRPVEELYARVNELKKTIPTISIGGDFIVGFPGETTEDFEKTVESIKELNLNYGHVFRFSERPGTAATEMSEKVDGNTMKERSQILRDLFDKQNEAFLHSLVGTKERVITEKEGELKGITGNYLSLSGIVDDTIEKNRFYNIEISSVKENKIAVTILS